MTPEQIEAHEDVGYEYHVPVIVHRTGEPSADELNICGVCGVEITRQNGGLWVEIDAETARKLRDAR